MSQTWFEEDKLKIYKEFYQHYNGDKVYCFYTDQYLETPERTYSAYNEVTTPVSLSLGAYVGIQNTLKDRITFENIRVDCNFNCKKYANHVNDQSFDIYMMQGKNDLDGLTINRRLSKSKIYKRLIGPCSISESGYITMKNAFFDMLIDGNGEDYTDMNLMFNFPFNTKTKIRKGENVDGVWDVDKDFINKILF